jgi:hypothetical protein
MGAVMFNTCPFCGEKLKNTYSDSINNTTCESSDACPNECIFIDFAYGSWVISLKDKSE